MPKPSHEPSDYQWICLEIDESHPMTQGLKRLLDFIHAGGGAHTIDVVVRKDGSDYHWQGDWIKYLRFDSPYGLLDPRNHE